VNILIVTDWPSYLADISVKHLPGIGKIATAAGSFYIKRGGDKE
jgi:hypothetical protein